MHILTLTMDLHQLLRLYSRNGQIISSYCIMLLMNYSFPTWKESSPFQMALSPNFALILMWVGVRSMMIPDWPNGKIALVE